MSGHPGILEVDVSRRRALAIAASLSLVGGLLAAYPVSTVAAAAGNPSIGMPSQAFLDGTSGQMNTGSSGIWTDMQGGVAARPYVQSLSVVNDGVTTAVISDAGVTPPPAPEGGLTAVVAPVNLCKAGQPAQAGNCYATPNRVAVTVVRAQGDTNLWDFTADSPGMSPRVDANTVIDMTIALNTLGRSLRWSWANGELLSWHTNRLGQDDATVHIRFHPAMAPMVTTFPPGNGCTATPVRDCAIDLADAEVRTAALLLSLDTTLDPALTGAAFATQNAFAGFLLPGGTASAPTLDIQVASTHRRPDGSPQLGILQAVLPAAALLRLYGIPANDAAQAFTATRAGDPGTNAPPTYAVWNAAENGTDGLLVTIRDITFSVPSYRLRSRIARATTTAAVAGKWTKVALRATSCTAKRRCLASIYDLGVKGQKSYLAVGKVIANRRPVLSRASMIRVPKRALSRGHAYAVVLKKAQTKKLVSTARGTVH
jgi:hypothetical protein